MALMSKTLLGHTNGLGYYVIAWVSIDLMGSPDLRVIGNKREMWHLEYAMGTHTTTDFNTFMLSR